METSGSDQIPAAETSDALPKHTMIGEFDPARYKDEYRARVLDLVEAKAKGKVIKFPKAPRRTETKDLTSVLQKSLAAAKRRKSA